MKITARAYAAAPTSVQNLLVTTYGWRLRRLRYGGIHAKTLAALRESQWFPAAEIQRRQTAQLRHVLDRARRLVPFYRARGDIPETVGSIEALRDIPTLTKAEVQTAGLALIADDVRRQQLEVVHTGGTTGTPLSIFCDAQTLQRNFAFFARLREWADIPPGARVATFAGRTIVPPASGAPYWRRNRAANQWLFSSYHLSPATVPTYVEALQAIQPMLIDSYPSSIEPIARYLEAQHITDLRPAAVITSSETLFPEVRALIERAFGCRVFDHYGGGEMAAFITQCEAGTYHVNPEYGIVEVLRRGRPVSAGEEGELVVTGFVNPVMPLIRYATGDRAVQGADQPCRCGRQFPTVAAIEGRLDDVIITPSGTRVGRLDPVFKVLTTPFETRIIQDAIDHVVVEFVASSELPPEEEAALRNELRARLGPLMAVSIRRVPSMQRTGRGKLRTVMTLLHGPHPPAADADDTAQ